MLRGQAWGGSGVSRRFTGTVNNTWKPPESIATGRMLRLCGIYLLSTCTHPYLLDISNLTNAKTYPIPSRFAKSQLLHQKCFGGSAATPTSPSEFISLTFSPFLLLPSALRASSPSLKQKPGWKKLRAKIPALTIAPSRPMKYLCVLIRWPLQPSDSSATLRNTLADFKTTHCGLE